MSPTTTSPPLEAVVEAHDESRIIHDFAIDPLHDDRTESAMFREAKQRLHHDGHMKCWVCGGTDNLQVHHRAGEWMFDNVIDYTLLKEFCEEWDIYGYGRLLRNNPITSVDDVRNQMVLCQPHHTGVNHQDGGGGTGIHALSFNSWIMQKLALPGANPIPQQGETFAQALERVQNHQRKPE